MEWFDGTITFKDPERPDFQHAKICLDKPGWLLYSVAERMTYAVPVLDVLEVTIDNLDWTGKRTEES